MSTVGKCISVLCCLMASLWVSSAQAQTFAVEMQMGFTFRSCQDAIGFEFDLSKRPRELRWTCRHEGGSTLNPPQARLCFASSSVFYFTSDKYIFGSCAENPGDVPPTTPGTLLLLDGFESTLAHMQKMEQGEQKSLTTEDFFSLQGSICDPLTGKADLSSLPFPWNLREGEEIAWLDARCAAKQKAAPSL